MEAPAGDLLDHPATGEELEGALDWVRESPADHGRLELVVRRPAVDERELLDEAELDEHRGLAGDSWQRRRSSATPDGSPDPERQLTLMNARIASLVARRPDRRALAGDQLFVDFDLSVENAPPGTRLRIGSAVVEITQPPHLGCSKFVSRFGEEAMRFVNSPVGRQLRLRGAHARVVVPGTVRTGDPIDKVVRADDEEAG